MRRRSRLEPRGDDGPPHPRDNPIRALDLRRARGRAIQVPLKATGRRDIGVESGGHRHWNGDRSTALGHSSLDASSALQSLTVAKWGQVKPSLGAR